MTDARTAFEDVLGEIETYGQLSAVEGHFRWSAEYLTRKSIFYQFSGACRAKVVSGKGQRFDGEHGTVTLLPCQLASPALSDFGQNEEIAFYTGMNTAISAIAREAVDCSVQTPEVMLIEIEIDDDDAFTQGRSVTHLAFVGLRSSFNGLSPCLPCGNVMTTEGMLHPIWCRDRRQPVAPPPILIA